MLQIDEKERAEFASLKEAMPDYGEICKFFQEMEEGKFDNMYEEGSAQFSDENLNFNPNQNNEFQYQQNYPQNVLNEPPSPTLGGQDQFMNQPNDQLQDFTQDQQEQFTQFQGQQQF
jgi:hypothetical protein